MSNRAPLVAASILVSALWIGADSVNGEMIVPAGFTSTQWSEQFWRLEAITNAEYGSGVVCAHVSDGALHLGTMSAPGEVDTMLTLQAQSFRGMRMDPTGAYGHRLLAFIQTTANDTVFVHEISPEWGTEIKVAVDDPLGTFAPVNEITGGMHGYPSGAMLMDASCCPQPIFGLDPQYNITLELDHWAPPIGRTDLDQTGMRLDPTGLYGGRLTITDADSNNDNLTAIYQLSPSLAWSTLVPPIPLSQRYFSALAYSTGGALGASLYVTDFLNGEILEVLPGGTLQPFASGFTQISAITIDASGDRMWVGSSDGVHLIAAEETAGIESDVSVRFELSSPAPNPVNLSLRSTLRLAQTGRVQAAIHDVGGALVAPILDSVLEAGVHELAWDRTPSVGSGVYFLSVVSGTQREHRKIVVVE